MSLGMEMLIKTAVKALGLEPELIEAQWNELRGFAIHSLKNFDMRLAQMEQKQNEIHAMLEALSGKVDPDTESAEIPPQLSIPSDKEAA